MNKKWKRFISSVMAMVMICSTFALGNVSSVFADESSESAVDSTTDTTESTPSDVGSIDFSAISDLGGEVTLDVADALASTVTGGTWKASDLKTVPALENKNDYTTLLATVGDYALYFGKRESDNCELTKIGDTTYLTRKAGVKVALKAGDKISVSFVGGNSDFSSGKVRTVSIYKGSNEDALDGDSLATATSAEDLKATSVSYTVPESGDGDYMIFESKNGYYGISEITITPAGSSGGDTSTYAGVSITENNADLGTFSLEGEGAYTLNDSFSSCTAADKNFSVGGNYTLTVTLSDNAESYSVDVTGGSYDETTKNIEIKEASVTITINYTKKETTTTTEATTEATTQAVTQSTTEADTETTTQAQTGETTYYKLNISANAGEINTETIIDSNNYFKLVPGTSTVAIEDGSVSLAAVDGTTSVAKTIDWNTGEYDRRAVGFKTLSSGKVYLYVTTGGARTFTLTNITDSNSEKTESLDSEVEAGEVVFDVEANKEYRLSVSKSATLIYICSTAELSPYTPAVTYTATLDTYDNTYPVVTLDKTEGLTGTETIKATWSANDTYKAGSKSINLSTLTATSDNVFVITPNDTWFTKLSEGGNVSVYNADTFVASYDTIADAVAAAKDGYIVKVKDGYYNEYVEITKKITLESESGNRDGVIIYSNQKDEPVEDTMYPVVNVAADGVVINNISIINTTYHDKDGTLTYTGSDVKKHAAVTVMAGSATAPCVFNNVKMVGIQDTVYINIVKDASDNKYANFNNCEIVGDTDWICGGGVVNFTACNYVFESAKEIGYIFAPSYNSDWTVNGGSVTGQLKGTASYYYARAWLNTTYSSVNYPKLNIYDLDLADNIKLGADGLMGFKGVVGDREGNADGIIDSTFNVYSGTTLIATTNKETLNTFDLLNQNTTTPSVDFEKNNNKLLLIDFGNTVNRTFSNNIINDVSSYGFAFIDETTYTNINSATSDTDKFTAISNAVKTSIDNDCAINSTALFKTISTTKGATNSLDINAPLTQSDSDIYYGAGIITSDTETITGTYYYIPYIVLDKTYTEGTDTYDPAEVYNYGDVCSVTFN